MNLEGYQPLVNKTFGTDFDIPVMYFTQLAGLALGVDPKKLAIDKQVVSCDRVVAAIPA
jgi:heterodisulfide reductase subunit B